jgi:small-conductance mechanosensitive channel
MRILAASIIIGPLVLVGALPTAADQLTPVAAIRQSADAGTVTSDRDEYIRAARDRMEEWQKKLREVGTRADAAGRKDASATERELHLALAEADLKAQELRSASAEGWENAKRSFENASRELADAWDRNRPAAK